MSIIDELFYEIYGYKPTKDGKAYEMLTSAVMKLLKEKNTVMHDERYRGIFSNTVYQLDLLVKNEAGQHMGEAKDYTERGSKVGRSDIQKLAGALKDLDVESGAFFSATDYTGPAKKYANSAGPMIGKKIELFHLRPTVERDKEGRITKIIIAMHILLPDYEKAKFSSILTIDGSKKARELIAEGLMQLDQPVRTDTIYNVDGTVMTTVQELTRFGFGGDFGSNAQGSFYLPGGHVSFRGNMLEIYGISYDVPFNETVENMVIEGEGIPKLLVKAENGDLDKLISDQDLNRVLFGPDGEVKLK